MILHLLRMRRNVNQNVFNDRENVTATVMRIRDGLICSESPIYIYLYFYDNLFRYLMPCFMIFYF